MFFGYTNMVFELICTLVICVQNKFRIVLFILSLLQATFFLLKTENVLRNLQIVFHRTLQIYYFLP